MSAFTPSEIEYLTSQGLARLATVGPTASRTWSR